MKVFTKRLSIRILSILLLGVLSLGGLFLHNGVKATAADAVEIATTSLLDTKAGVKIEDGLRVSSDSAYQAEVKGVFKGDTTLVFKFPETYDANKGYYGDFRIRVADVDDESKYFEIIYGIAANAKGTVCTTSYVQYTPAGGATQIRSSHRQKDMFYNKVITNELTNASFPNFLSYTSYDVGYVELVWTDDVVAVKTSKKSTGGETTAEFDGTYDPTDTARYGFAAVDGNLEATKFGLPTLEDFKDGYKISFSSDFTVNGVADHGTDVCITEITSNDTSYSLAVENLTEPSFYTNYMAWLKNNPLEELKLSELLEETTGTVSADGGLRISSDSAYEGTVKGVFKGDTTLVFNFPEKYDANKGYYGDFRIRISDVDDESKYFDIVYGIVTKSNGNSVTTVHLEYTPEGGTTQIRSSHRQKDMFYNRKITEEITNATYPCFLSHIIGDPKYWNLSDDGYVKLVWTDDVLSVRTKKQDYLKSDTLAEFDGTKSFKAVDGSLENTTFGLPTLEDFKDGYKVSFSSNFTVDGVDDHGTDVCFKQIAGTLMTGESVQAKYKYETTFENATVSGMDVYIPQNEEIGEIKGIYSHTYGNSWYEKTASFDVTQAVDVSTVGDKTLTITDDTWKDTILGAISKTYTVHVETPYTLKIDFNDGDTIQEIVHSKNTTNRIVVPENPERLFWVFDGWFIGDQEWTGDISELSEKNETLKARWLDMDAPTIWLNGVNDVTYAAKGQTITVGKADVVAGDAAQNESVVVTLAVKKPDETKFTEITSETLSLDMVGSYLIQYTVKDGAGYTATCERAVEVCERELPTFIVEEGYITQTYTGINVALATVTAQNASGEALDIMVSIVKDGVLIENNGTSFLAASLGEYTVTFYAADKEPYETLKNIYSYTVVVSHDDVAPEIGNEFTDMTVKKNTQITIPTITATDNVSGSVPVEVSVYYGTQKIQLTNGKFTADQEGSYRVLLTAEDEAGNRSEKTVYVTVEVASNGGNGGGGCSGCGASGDLGLPMGLLMILSSFVFGKNIMMKRKENI